MAQAHRRQHILMDRSSDVDLKNNYEDPRKMPYENGSYRPHVTSKDKPKKSRDVDEFLETYRNYKDIMYYANQTNLANRRQSLYWPVSTTSFSIPAVKSVLSSLMSFSLADNPLMDCIIAYRGFVCKDCLRTCIMPVWGFRETGKIEPTHDCGELIPSVTDSKNALTDINILNQKLLEDLKSVVNKWTNDKSCLVANLCSKEKDLINLTIPREDTQNWAIRTVNGGQTILSDAELLDFLKLSGYRTYSHFGFNY